MNLRIKEKHLSIKQKGVYLTLLITIILLLVFFSKILWSPNTTFFSTSGDGFETYYLATYHIKYDNSYLNFKGMNYPYGQFLPFNDIQPLMVDILKFVSNNIFNISGYTVGIYNMVMLLLLLMAPLIIFLIFYDILQFKNIKPGDTFDLFIISAASVAITFLSPQIQRLPGHYSLSYVFIIPLLILLFIKFYKFKSYKLSILTGAIFFILTFTHIYYLGIFIILFLSYWFLELIRCKFTLKSIKEILNHVILQFILPFLLIQLIFYFGDKITDRTEYPWGFLEYKSSWQSIFLPLNKPYAAGILGSMNQNNFNWEGYAFIGIIALLGFIYILRTILLNILQLNFRTLINITDNPVLNIFFWASVAALIYSMGIPFILGHQGWIKYLGPFKQMRSIARFSWIFYYVINITVIYILFNKASLIKNADLRKILIIIPIIFLCYDSWLNARGLQNLLNNKVPELDDKNNSTTINKWVAGINPDKYQAIIPIPYFHAGSENYWISAKHEECDMIKNAFIVSLKTGLPITAAIINRGSISQALKSISIILEPYRNLEITKDLPNEKPFLLIVSSCQSSLIGKNERYIINQSIFLDKNESFSIYELPFSVLKNLGGSLYEKTIAEINSIKLNKQLVTINNANNSSVAFLTTNKEKDFYYQSFDSISNTIRYRGDGAYRGDIREWNIIYENIPQNYKLNKDYLASFWFYNAAADVYPRTTLEVICIDQSGNAYKYDYSSVWQKIVVLDGNWGLVEFKFRLNKSTDKLRITLWNKDVFKGDLIIDELIIRLENEDIYEIMSNGIMKNNRFYLK